MAVRYTTAAKKAPNPIDEHVRPPGAHARRMLAMSQGRLGDALGLTFQQVQKYEKGTNRIGASRLQQKFARRRWRIRSYREADQAFGLPKWDHPIIQSAPNQQ